MTTVSLQITDSYDAAAVRAAVDAHFAALSVADDLRPGMRVVLKPNLLAARKPEQCVTTHPAIIRAVAEWLRGRGVTDIVLADSPGGLYNGAAMRSVYHACGLRGLEDVLTLNDDFEWETVPAPEGLANRSFSVIRALVRADYVINLAKLKTHGMTVMSGGIKNLFGAIPGLQKPEMHYRYPDGRDFAGMLLDLARTVAPAVTLIDAVDGMEGNGPNAGSPRHLGLTLASRDVFAQDWIAAGLMGVDPAAVPMLAIARERGWIEPDAIRTVGAPAAPAAVPFRLPDSVSDDLMHLLPGFIRKPVNWACNALLKPFPQVDAAGCIGCGKCAESCPAGRITLQNKKAVIDRKGCISCFCCQEMCPAKTIRVRRRLKR